MLNISGYVENYNMCTKLCWCFNNMLKISACVESYVKISRCVENVYVRHVENHIENRVEVWKKNTSTLYGTCWNWAADFVFLLRFCTRKRSETYIYRQRCLKKSLNVNQLKFFYLRYPKHWKIHIYGHSWFGVIIHHKLIVMTKACSEQESMRAGWVPTTP